MCELTWNTFRDHLVLEYEIPKYDGDVGSPNVFVPLSESIVDAEDRLAADALREPAGQALVHATTCSRRRSASAGMESNSPSGQAEAFYCRKLVL